MITRPWEKTTNQGDHEGFSQADYIQSSALWQLSKQMHQIRSGLQAPVMNQPQSLSGEVGPLRAGEKRKLTVDSDKKKFYGEETRMPHRLIEKKRRDRINLSIGCLKDLLPDEMKTENARPLEKAVVLELTIKYIRQLQKILSSKDIKPSAIDLDSCLKRNNGSYMSGYQDAVAKLQAIFPTYQDSMLNRNASLSSSTSSFEIKQEPSEFFPFSNEQATEDRHSSSGYDSGDNKKTETERDSESPIDVVGLDNPLFTPYMTQNAAYPIQLNSFLQNQAFKKS